jgi:hypothetical protein
LLNGLRVGDRRSLAAKKKEPHLAVWKDVWLMDFREISLSVKPKYYYRTVGKFFTKLEQNHARASKNKY